MRGFLCWSGCAGILLCKALMRKWRGPGGKAKLRTPSRSSSKGAHCAFHIDHIDSTSSLQVASAWHLVPFLPGPRALGAADPRGPQGSLVASVWLRTKRREPWMLGEAITQNMREQACQLTRHVFCGRACQDQDSTGHRSISNAANLVTTAACV